MRVHKGVLYHLIGSIFWRFGYVLIPIAEIERMEDDAAASYSVTKRPGISERNKGYFNGLGDYSSKTASRFRSRYTNGVKTLTRETMVTRELKRLGFDRSFFEPVEKVLRVKCSRCSPVVIQGVPCHEKGCPNEKKRPQSHH